VENTRSDVFTPIFQINLVVSFWQMNAAETDDKLWKLKKLFMATRHF
jgi:hypothetical protein